MFMSTATAAEVGPLGPPQPAGVVGVVRRRIHHARQRKVPFTISRRNSYGTALSAAVEVSLRRLFHIPAAVSFIGQAFA